MRIMICVACFALAQAATETRTLRGWLSDEQCARARASSGGYTGTNPECAKRCVAQGKKIVFIDPNGREVLDISNQEAARANAGDQVEVMASIDPASHAMHIESLKLLARGVEMCTRPARKH